MHNVKQSLHTITQEWNKRNNPSILAATKISSRLTRSYTLILAQNTNQGDVASLNMGYLVSYEKARDSVYILSKLISGNK